MALKEKPCYTCLVCKISYFIHQVKCVKCKTISQKLLKTIQKNLAETFSRLFAKLFSNYNGLTDVNSITWNHLKHGRCSNLPPKRFSLNCLASCSPNSLSFLGLNPSFPFMKDVWLGLYHYSNHFLTVVSFLLKHTSHLNAHILTLVQYFLDTLLFCTNGDLHRQSASICAVGI